MPTYGILFMDKNIFIPKRYFESLQNISLFEIVKSKTESVFE